MLKEEVHGIFWVILKECCGLVDGAVTDTCQPKSSPGKCWQVGNVSLNLWALQ